MKPLLVNGRMANDCSFLVDPSWSRMEKRVLEPGPGWEVYPKRMEVNLTIGGKGGTLMADCFGPNVYHNGAPNDRYVVHFTYFDEWIGKFVESKGRRIIGWTEIVEGGLAPKAALQSWLDPKHAVAAANSGHDVVMSTNSSCYLNYRGLSLKKCYAFEPTPPGLSAEGAKHILGMEPCL